MLYDAKVGEVLIESTDSSYLLTIFTDRGIISLIIFFSILYITLTRAHYLSSNKFKYFKFKSLSYALIALFLCLNSSQRFEALFLFFFIIGMINKLYLVNTKKC